MILRPSFFNRSGIKAAKELLGKYLVRKIGNKTIVAMITEVEVYEGAKDRASHAYQGITERNYPMFGAGGRWYVYLVYGFHWMLNIVTGPRNFPAAILIRAVQFINGPGRLTKFFKIGKKFNNEIANAKTGLWIEDRGIKIKKSNIMASSRVGVDYAGPIWSKKHLRFYLATTL